MFALRTGIHWLGLALAFALTMLIATLWAFPAMFQPRNPKWLAWVGRSVRGPVRALIGTKIDIEKALPTPDLQAQAVLYAVNHQHKMDSLITALCLPSRTVVLCKQQLAWAPWFGQLLWLFGCLFVRRRSSEDRHEVLQQMRASLKERGASLWIFPEGTRDKDALTRPFHEGSFELAKKTEIPVVPVAIEPYVAKIPAGHILPTNIRVRFLPALHGQDYADGAEFAEACRDAIHTQLKQWLEES